ncbi:MAG: phenylacetate--CoA ligase family protein [Lachnospiraceae bacterium]|nr:phenylacetate--CoA ligase family protein [Lachnospiraceae bacterium]
MISVSNKLERSVKSAYSEVPFYMNLLYESNKSIDDILSGNFEDLPFTEKNKIVEHSGDVISARYIPKYLSKELLFSRTSGSTGKYMDIYWAKDDFTKSMLELWIMRKKYYGIFPKDRMCCFYTIQETDIKNEQDEYKEENAWIFSKVNLSTARIIEIYKKMCEFKPKWLILQPSIAVLLCQCIKNNSLMGLDSVEYIEFNGEILTDEVRKLTKETFNCNIANQYGANEFNSIAYECPYGNMHIMDSNVYAEAIDEDGKAVTDKCGEICVTTLTNNAMPLIRYKIGDVGAISERKCECGNCSKVISLMSGRKNDFVICEDGTRITSYVFVRAIDNVNLVMDGVVKQFNIIQKDINKFTVKFVVDEDENLCQLEEIFKESVLEDRLAYAEYEFEYFERLLPDEKTGKLRYFLREMDEI